MTSSVLIESRGIPSDPEKSTRPKTMPSAPGELAARRAISSRFSNAVMVSTLNRKSVSSASSAENTCCFAAMYFDSAYGVSTIGATM